jgi:peptidoglycan/LPS O-acetylase OafA/YrhL
LSLRYLSIAGSILIAAALYAPLQTEYRGLIANSWTLMLAYTFCGGVLIGYLFDQYNSKYMFKVKTALALSIFMIIILSYLNHYHYALPEYIKELPIIGMRMNMMGVIAIVLVFVMLFTNFDHLIKSKLSISLEFLGEISYGMYLFHTLFIAIAVLLVINLHINDETIKLFFITTFTLLGTVSFSVLSYRYVELPGIKFRKKLINNIQ